MASINLLRRNHLFKTSYEINICKIWHCQDVTEHHFQTVEMSGSHNNLSDKKYLSFRRMNPYQTNIVKLTLRSHMNWKGYEIAKISTINTEIWNFCLRTFLNNYYRIFISSGRMSLWFFVMNSMYLVLLGQNEEKLVKYL